MTIVDSPAAPSRSLTSTVALAWLLAGTLDVSTAVLYYTGLSRPAATRLLQGIASGLLGPNAAYSGGDATALLGLALHYLIALIWAIVLFGAFRAVPALRRQLILTGVTYGVVVWCVMNLVVLPLSNARRAPFQFRGAAIGAIILVFCIGLPLSLVIGRRLRTEPT
jgi:hypothetical protein